MGVREKGRGEESKNNRAIYEMRVRSAHVNRESKDIRRTLIGKVSLAFHARAEFHPARCFQSFLSLSLSCLSPF